MAKGRGRWIQKWKKDYAKGDQSPYWEWLDKKANKSGDHSNSGSTEFIEHSDANPDVLGEDAAMFSTVFAEEDIEKLDSIREGIELLTEKEKEVLLTIASGYRQVSVYECSLLLGMNKDEVRRLLKQAIVKIKRHHLNKFIKGED